MKKPNHYLDSEKLRQELVEHKLSYDLAYEHSFNRIYEGVYLEIYEEKYEILVQDLRSQGLTKEEAINEAEDDIENEVNDRVDKLAKKDAMRDAVISEELGQMILDIAENQALRGNFRNYTYIDEMKGRGIEHMCMYAHSFDIVNYNTRSKAFAYMSKICYNGFRQYLKIEDKLQKYKDKKIKENIEHTKKLEWADSSYLDG